MNFQNYIKMVRASGRYAFTAEEAIAKLNISKNAFNCGIYKLKKKKEIVSPAKHLYIVVPPEYQSLGCLPAEELVPILMKYFNVTYYICCLSAAYYHGASHQKPQLFQVMTNKRLKDIECGKVKIVFGYKRNLNPLLVEKRVVKTGYLFISLPELTILDLLNYRRLAGGLNSTATVLSELIEVMDPKRLSKLIAIASENAWWQRLGYILEQIDVMDTENRKKILSVLRRQAKVRQLNPVPLVPGLSEKGMKRDVFWKIIENATIEVDE